MKTPEGEYFTDTSAEGIKNRIENFISRNIGAEQEDSFDKADKRWVGFDRLIRAIKNKVELDELINSAKMLLDEQEGYLINAGLSILALPDVIEWFKENNNVEELTTLFSKYIPTEERLSSLGQRDSEMYNFIRSVEGLLSLDPEGVWQNELTEKHKEILEKCCESPDMRGTKIYIEYGENPK